MTCPDCEYNKRRAQLWRNEAYKLGGHPLGWEPELMIRPKPLAQEQLHALYDKHAAHQEESPEASGWWDFARAIEAAHGIK